MGYVRGEAPGQNSLFPPTLDELVPEDHPVRVMAAFVETLDLAAMGFERAEPSHMGRPAYDPADLLKLYLYGYLNRIRSSRRLERECHRNVELMWLLGRLAPDFKTIAEFRRRNGAGFVNVCRGFVRFCAREGLISGELVAIDGSKFQAVGSKRQVVRAKNLEEQSRRLDARISQYLKSMEEADREEGAGDVDRTAVAAALRKLRQEKANCDSAKALLDELGTSQHVIGEPEAKLMRMSDGAGHKVAYNVQTAVDAEHGLIVHHEVTSEGTDSRLLEPMAKGAQQALGGKTIKVVADAGYSNQGQFEACEKAGITPFVALNPGLNTQGDGQLYPASAFTYDSERDLFRCPAGRELRLKQIDKRQHYRIYAARVDACASCSLKSACTQADRRYVTRHDHEAAGQRMIGRLAAVPDIMQTRRALAEHPFAHLKFGILGQPRFLLRGLRGASAEMAIAVLVRNLARVLNILGAGRLKERLAAT